MPYGDPLSQIGTTNGMAVELRLGTSKYVDGLNGQNKKTSDENAVVAVPSRSDDKARATPITIDYTSTYSSTSLGMDPMVSQASVIHELAYGRIGTFIPKAAGGTGYPIPRDSSTHYLDVVV